MGLFNYVDMGNRDCPDCGLELHGWQTKDGLDDFVLDTLNPGDLETCPVLNAYTACEHCGAWVEYVRHVTAVGPWRRIAGP